MNPKVLVTGATGYIGGRLVPKLLDAGYPVKVLVRDPDRILDREWADKVEIVTGNVLDQETLEMVMDDVSVAYYLVHSMGSGPDFHKRDIDGARNFGSQAKEQGVDRIIYLGGLGESDAKLSKHLTSRHETGEELRASGVPVTEFRAAVVVGAGSVSFEIVRYLVERLPAMICPSWVYTKTQPIGINDLLEYLVSSITVPESSNKVIEIGGRDVVTYGNMMLGYAKARGLKRWLLPVPILTPRLSSYWVHLVTPIPASIGRPLIEGLRNEVIVRNTDSQELFPNINPASYLEAVRITLEDLEFGRIESSWSDAVGKGKDEIIKFRMDTMTGFIFEQRALEVSAPKSFVYKCFSGIGAKRGWFHATWLWRLRGWIDRFIGGVGLRRGRRHPDDIRIGDALDFWRVEDVDKNRMIHLRAEMKVPGRAWLQFKVTDIDGNKSHLEQTAIFAPKGLFGLLYWYALYPVHGWIFGGLIKKIRNKSEMEFINANN